MREIKFRAWIKSIGKMFEAAGIHESDVLLFRIEEDRALKDKLGFKQFIRDEHIDCIPMQYTGLKDKNDKEIYEDDILEYSEPDYPNKDKHVVTFSSGRFSCCDLLTDKYWEVIGNIYENPGLIKGETE